MRIQYIAAAFVGLLLGPMASAHAEDNGFYFGAGISAVNTDGCRDAFGSSACDIDFEDTSLGARGTLGFQFSEWFSTELGLHHLGEVSYLVGYSAAGPGPACAPAAAILGLCPPNVEDTTSANGASLSLVAHTDPSNWLSVYGRLGGFMGVVDQSRDVNAAFFGPTGTETDFTYILGIGAEGRIGNGFSVRAEVEYIPSLGTDSTAQADYIPATLSLVWRPGRN